MVSLFKGTRRKAARLLSDTSLLEILRHARNYFAGDVATKALGFISLPIFTRLMSEESYGIVAVYISTIAVLGSLTTLNATDGISRYYYEKGKNDFGQFLSSTIQFVLIIHVPIVIFSLVAQKEVMQLLNLPEELLFFVLIGLFYGIVYRVFSQVVIAQKMSSKYVRVNVVQAYGGFGLSWLLLKFGMRTEYFLRISGLIIMQLIGSIWMACLIRRHVIWRRLQWRHVKYGLQFSLPRLPYVLSGVILSQFDRIMISNIVGPAEAGFYSVGYNVGGLSFLIIGAITPAMLPNFYELMNNRKHKEVDELNQRITWIVVATGIALMFIGGPLLRLLADKRFHAGAEIVPAVVMGYIFYSIAGVYNRFCGYYKTTFLQSCSALVGGVVNIVLNYLWIPKYGMVGASYATIVAYGCQAFLGWALITSVAKDHVTPFSSLWFQVFVAMVSFSLIVWI